MTHRERVLASLKHQEFDRIPIDLGGMDSTGIHGIAYNKLKQYLDIKQGKTRIIDPYQQVVLVEVEVLEVVGADVVSVPFQPKKWKPGTLSDGSSCEIPQNWNPVKLPDGSQVVYGTDNRVVARMPVGGFYFEPGEPPLARAETVADVEKNLDYIWNFDLPDFCDMSFEEIGTYARQLCEKTDYCLMGNFAIHVFAAGQLLRGFEQFMIDLVLNPAIAECIMDNLVNAYIERFNRYYPAIGKYTDIINVNDDLGAQNGPQISPDLYRKLVKPYQKKIYQHIKKVSGQYLFLHTDGSVYELLPDLIEIGVDILNPVQFTCRNMELGRLKKEFGKDLTFWGGGCDTQKVLPYATPAQVKKHVKECLDILVPGGGFVFNQVHNIQPDVPPANIMAMYEAVHEWKG
ncbi:MAG: uroporphyrinogen decarboxylase family protein [Candidatus Omnitrophica bacterium]|nr:uroporphyrinogen decarboxylase family protein [Candidatus Omnitrophota bacterium]